MKSAAPLVFIAFSGLCFADSYGLTAPTSAVPVGASAPSAGYGLIPSDHERAGVVRTTRLDTHSYSAQPGQVAVGTGTTASGYGTARASGLTVGQPNMQHFQPAAGQRYSTSAAGSRYSSGERVSRKQYDVGVTGQRDLAQVMRAPVQFASGEPRQIRQLQGASGGIGKANLQGLRAKVGGQGTTSTASLGKANLQGLQAKINPSSTAQSAAATAGSLGKANLQGLQAKVGGVNASQSSVATASVGSLGKANLQGLQAKLKPAAPAAANTAAAKPANLAALQAKAQPAAQVAAVKAAPSAGAANLSSLQAKLNKAPQAQTEPVGASAAQGEKPLSSDELSETIVVKAKAPKRSDQSFLDSVTDALGVVDVKPWQKAKLAEQSMKKGGAIPSLAKFSGKVFISKEASRGGQGVAGGGCGCN